MGAGKTSAAIWHINHSEEKFLYCTPYLTEVDRILRECSAKRFFQPTTGKSGIGGKKYSLMNLMTKGYNVATTHSLFGLMGAEAEDDEGEREQGDADVRIDDNIISLAKGKYSLIIDEAYDVIQTTGIHKDDISTMIDAGLAEIKGGRLFVTEKGCEYKGTAYKEAISKIRERTIVTYKEGEYTSLIYPPDTFDAFEDVYILTYLFDGSVMQSYFDMSGLKYQRIGVRPVDDHYEFFDGETLLPNYVLDIKDKIEICDEPKLNGVGGVRDESLSKNWYKNHIGDGGVDMLRRNHITFLHRCMVGKENSSLIMWTTFLKYKKDMTDWYASGKRFVSLGTKATNMYANRRYLAFLANIFINPNLKITLWNMDVDVSEDVYALSSLVQWVWRSAIRNGEPIKIYIPSKRMRELFIGWLDDITAQAAAQRVELAGV